jgi:signal peptidase I
MDNTQIYIVPPGKFFAMGDNRDNSQDSRYLDDVGYIPAENLIGRAEFIFFSHNENARWWEVWKWPSAIRFDRIFQSIN